MRGETQSRKLVRKTTFFTFICGKIAIELFLNTDVHSSICFCLIPSPVITVGAGTSIPGFIAAAGSLNVTMAVASRHLGECPITTYNRGMPVVEPIFPWALCPINKRPPFSVFEFQNASKLRLVCPWFLRFVFILFSTISWFVVSKVTSLLSLSGPALCPEWV